MDKSEASNVTKELKKEERVFKLMEDPVIYCSTGNSVNSESVTDSNNRNAQNQEFSEKSGKQNESENIVLSKADQTENSKARDISNFDILQNEESVFESAQNVDILFPIPTNNSLKAKENEVGMSTQNDRPNQPIIKISKPLCADYRSDSDSESVDSESDSSTILTCTTTETSSKSETESNDSLSSDTEKSKTEKKKEKPKKDLSLFDLPPIEDLKITVPENECVEIGSITGIVETLVIVESYKNSAALDVDTVLFLDWGQKTLGKVFDILGPITEPVYAVRFNSQEEIENLNVKKDLKVFYAPKTKHTNFVFMSEVLKHRGSDASWKDNTEAPSEFQDFSDDEEERLHKNKKTKEFLGETSGLEEQKRSRKRPFCKIKQTFGVLQPNRFKNPDFSSERSIHFQKKPSSDNFIASPAYPRANLPSFIQATPFFYHSLPRYQAISPFTRPSNMYFPPRFSGPPFPAFNSHSFLNQNQNFQLMFYQQRTHAFSPPFGAWGRSMLRLPPPLPPPPPPPLAEQNDQQTTSEAHP